MRQVLLRGSYAELGRSYGEIIVEQGLNWWWEAPGEKKLAFVKACEREIAIHAPGFLDELSGIAEVSRTESDIVLANLIVSGGWQQACNVVAVTGARCTNGRTVFARNHDWLEEDREWVTCYRTSPTDGLTHIGFGFADPGRYDGLNEAGLAIASASIPFYMGRPQPGLRMNVATRWILDHFADVPSAVGYLQSIPHQEAVCYLLADPSGVIARVEVVPEGIDVCMQSDGMLAAVNFLQSEALEGLDRVPSPDNIVVRYRERIAAWYDQHNGSIDLAKLQSLCADNANGLCDHGETWDQPAGTIYSWTAELGTNRLQVADGRPCEVGYQATQLEIDLTSA